jgi:hypothetical protein
MLVEWGLNGEMLGGCLCVYRTGNCVFLFLERLHGLDLDLWSGLEERLNYRGSGGYLCSTSIVGARGFRCVM